MENTDIPLEHRNIKAGKNDTVTLSKSCRNKVKKELYYHTCFYISLDLEDQLLKKCFSVTYYYDHLRKSTATPKSWAESHALKFIWKKLHCPEKNTLKLHHQQKYKIVLLQD